jgi:hypothetical protein
VEKDRSTSVQSALEDERTVCSRRKNTCREREAFAELTSACRWTVETLKHTVQVTILIAYTVKSEGIRTKSQGGRFCNEKIAEVAVSGPSIPPCCRSRRSTAGAFFAAGRAVAG